VANATTAGKIYLETTGQATDRATKVSYILFTPAAASDQMVLRETSSGSNVLVIQGSEANKTMLFDFSFSPLYFNDGIYIQTLTSGAKATLITTSRGGN
jgi:hypothetical protein